MLPLAFFIGILVYLGLVLGPAQEPAMFYQVGALVAVIVYALTFAHAVFGIGLLVACIGLSPEISLGGMAHLRLEDFLVPALAASWLTRTAMTQECLLPSRIKGPMIAYLAAMAISTALGVATDRLDAPRALTYLGKYVEYFLIFLLVTQNVREEREFRALVTFTLLSSLGGALLGSARLGQEPSWTVARLHGPLGETATIFGGYLLLNFSLAVGLFLHAATLRGRLLTSAAIALLGVSIVYTYSRTTYAALVAGMAAFGIFKHRRLLLMVLILLVLFPVLAPDTVWSRARTLAAVMTEAQPESWVSRVYAWEAAAERLMDQGFVFGFGLSSVNLGDVDNEYVRVALDLGLVGLLLFAWLLFRLWRVADAAHASLESGTFFKGFASGYLIGFFALLVHGVGATPFTSIRTMEMFMVVSGLLVCLANRREEWSPGAGDRPVPYDGRPAASPAGVLPEPG